MQATTESTLREGRKRFLAHAIEHAFSVGRRSTDDFVRHFPPLLIMHSLRDAPRLRANILVLATGMHEVIALKKSVATAAEDVELALADGAIDAKAIVMTLDPDERVQHLDARRLWQFLIEGAFWSVSPTNTDEFEVAQHHLAFLLERAIADGLITHRHVVEGITLNTLVTRLPKSELERIIWCALTSGRNGGHFDDNDLMRTSTTATIVRYVPMAHIWTSVVEPYIAQAHGYMEPADDFEPVSMAAVL